MGVFAGFEVVLLETRSILLRLASALGLQLPEPLDEFESLPELAVSSSKSVKAKAAFRLPARVLITYVGGFATGSGDRDAGLGSALSPRVFPLFTFEENASSATFLLFCALIALGVRVTLTGVAAPASSSAFSILALFLGGGVDISTED